MRVRGILSKMPAVIVMVASSFVFVSVFINNFVVYYLILAFSVAFSHNMHVKRQTMCLPLTSKYMIFLTWAADIGAKFLSMKRECVNEETHHVLQTLPPACLEITLLLLAISDIF